MLLAALSHKLTNLLVTCWRQSNAHVKHELSGIKETKYASLIGNNPYAGPHCTIWNDIAITGCVKVHQGIYDYINLCILSTCTVKHKAMVPMWYLCTQ